MRFNSLVFFMLLSASWASVSGKLVYNHQYKQPIHTYGCYGLEVAYGFTHKMHAAALSYIAHFNPNIHTKVGAGFSNKNLLLVFNTYHINVWNRYESAYFNFLLGGQGSYKLGQNSWQPLATKKRYNFGVKLGLEFKKYLTDVVCFVLSAALPISFLDCQQRFNYHLSCGLAINF